jgi:hypothetical protein
LRSIGVGRIGRRLIAFDEVGWNARGRAGNAAREYNLALARKLLLAVEHVGIEHFGRIELPAFGAGAKRKHNGQGRPETKQ